MEKREVILSGMRPTGALHIGHYVGVIKNWVQLQNQYKCFFFTADWHALTSCFDEIDIVNKARLEYVRGWLACGVDPEKAIIYNQSSIPEILNLSQLFLCLTPPGWADRSPSWKDMQENNFQRKLDNLGFYSYPILMTADIAIVKGNFVPVGEDQITHIEIAREIVRKFNRLYNTDIPEPAPLLTQTPKLLGFGGKKMSSSLGNVISLRETEKSLQKKVNKLMTDDQRGAVENAGNPDNCSVYEYHKVFSTPTLCHEINVACRAAGISCGECKQKLGEGMKQELIPISERMDKISDETCRQVLSEGTEKARQEIRAHWDLLQSKIGFNK